MSNTVVVAHHPCPESELSCCRTRRRDRNDELDLVQEPDRADHADHAPDGEPVPAQDREPDPGLVEVEEGDLDQKHPLRD